MVTGVGPVLLDAGSAEEGKADFAVWCASDGAVERTQHSAQPRATGLGRKECGLQPAGPTEAVQTFQRVQALLQFLWRPEDGGCQSHRFEGADAGGSQLQAPPTVLYKDVLMPIPRDEYGDAAGERGEIEHVDPARPRRSFGSNLQNMRTLPGAPEDARISSFRACKTEGPTARDQHCSTAG